MDQTDSEHCRSKSNKHIFLHFEYIGCRRDGERKSTDMCLVCSPSSKIGWHAFIVCCTIARVLHRAHTSVHHAINTPACTALSMHRTMEAHDLNLTAASTAEIAGKEGLPLSSAICVSIPSSSTKSAELMIPG